ncbi:hypothetical protein MALU111345_17970 [Marinicrinis lubricantis]
MKQIILITDGCSNVGMDPVAAAAHARSEEIIVNVIGVVDQGEIGRLGTQEVQSIAEAGGGMSRIVSVQDLSRTVQMVTRKTVMSTVQIAVQKELKQMMDSDSIEDLHPVRRAKAVQIIDQLSEQIDLKVVLLIDASASMKSKLSAVENAIHDLMLSLQAREGRSEIAVFHFPGSGWNEDAALDMAWTKDTRSIPRLFDKLDMKGATPTGPAMMEVIRYITGVPANEEHDARGKRNGDEEGLWSDYIV